MNPVRGLVTPRRLSEDALAALVSGDIDALLAVNRAEFGGFRMMADEDDDDDDDTEDDDTSGDDDDDDDVDKSKSKKKGKDDSDDDDDDDSESETEKYRKRMKAADKRAEKAERELRELRDKDKPELERAQSELEEVTAERDSLKKEINDLRLSNAFLTANSITWHDPDTALALAGSKGYLDDVVDDDGEVDKKALKKALERLSKEHKYLVKSDKPGKDDDDDDLGPSGEPAGGRSDNGKDDAAKKAQLKRRFPVLNR